MEIVIVIVGGLVWYLLAHRTVDTGRAVADATGSESTGSGCGCALGSALFLIFAVVFVLALVATMPEDCQTIAINRAMGRCP